MNSMQVSVFKQHKKKKSVKSSTLQRLLVTKCYICSDAGFQCLVTSVLVFIFVLVFSLCWFHLSPFHYMSLLLFFSTRTPADQSRQVQLQVMEWP